MQQSRMEESGFELQIPWNSNTARSFGLALLVNAALLWLFFQYANITVTPRDLELQERIPTMIVFGLGDGTGISKGNLEKEGAKRAGKETPTPLEDAQRAPENAKRAENTSSEHPNAIPNIVQEKRAETSSPKKDEAREGKQDIGASITNPDEAGRGLGDFGGGAGKGEGFGDVEWGGGGNRVVLRKELPNYPRGVNRSVEVRLRFTVTPDGRVTHVMPVKQGEPALSVRAVNALKQWRFGPISEQKDMFGFITFTFRI